MSTPLARALLLSPFAAWGVTQYISLNDNDNNDNNNNRIPSTALVAGGKNGLFTNNTFDPLVMEFNSYIRFGRALYNGCFIAFSYKKECYGLERHSEEYKMKAEKVHQKAANAILHVCMKHGGIYTKFGQYLASLNNILPKQFTDTLKILQDKNPSISFEEVEKLFLQEFNVSINEIFEEFEEQPIAAASLAQVHKAIRKKDQALCAVKIQYPKLQTEIENDIVALRFLSYWLGKVFPDYEYTWLYPEFEKSIRLELDFRQEALNSERIKKVLKHRIDAYVPDVIWDLTTNRILTMEFIDGIKITNIDDISNQGMDIKEIGNKVTSIFSEMIFVHGFVNCDPHAGKKDSNSMMKKESEIVLLDHGMYRRLDEKFRIAYCNLWKGMLISDKVLGLQAAKALGITDDDLYDILSLISINRSPDSTSKLGDKISKSEQLRLKEKFKGKFNPQKIQEFIGSLPRDFLFVLRTNALVRGINKEIGNSNSIRFRTFGQGATMGLNVKEIYNNNDNNEAADNNNNNNNNNNDLFYISPILNELRDNPSYNNISHGSSPIHKTLRFPDANVNKILGSELEYMNQNSYKERFMNWISITNLNIRVFLMDQYFQFLEIKQHQKQLLVQQEEQKLLSLDNNSNKETSIVTTEDSVDT